MNNNCYPTVSLVAERCDDFMSSTGSSNPGSWVLL